MISLRFPRPGLPWVALISWGFLILCLGSLWIQFQAGVYETSDILWVPFAVPGLLTSLFGVFWGIKRLFLGPKRFMGLIWTLIALGPVATGAGITIFMFHEQANRNLPNHPVHKIGRMAAVSLLKWAAALRYSGRLQTDRVIMYFDEQVIDPQKDMARMEAHLERLEGILEKHQRFPIHWVRGKAMRLGGMCIHGVALGSAMGPMEALDRHEVAHAFLYQFSHPVSEPPMLLLEGWAMAVDGHPEPLAATALEMRKVFTIWRKDVDPLCSILDLDLYHVRIPFAYEFGGPFVDFLLRRFGPDKFLDFYNLIHPELLDKASREVFGYSFVELEKEFWADVEASVPREKAVNRLLGWAQMLETQEAVTERDKKLARLFRLLKPDESVRVLKGGKIARISDLAASVGLSVEVSEVGLKEAALKLTLMYGETHDTD